MRTGRYRCRYRRHVVRFRQFVFAAMIPMNVAMILWVWVGRGVFGATLGWVMLIFAFTAVPVMTALLTLSTVLAYRQRARPVRLTAAQAWTQVALWTILLALGAVVFDVDDNTHEESILINLVGWQSGETLSLSADLMRGLGLVALVCWAVLVALLTLARTRSQPFGAPP